MTNRIAILSDIHGNMEALLAVLTDVKKRGINRIYILGDVIGYGPNPKEVLDILIDLPGLEVLMAGNHDMAIMHKNVGYRWAPHAVAAIEWARRELFPDQKGGTLLPDAGRDELITSPELQETNEYYRFLTGMEQQVKVIGELALCHANPYESTGLDKGEFSSTYVTNIDLATDFLGYLAEGDIFKNVQLCFCGHSHKPLAFVADKKMIRSWQDVTNPCLYKAYFEKINGEPGEFSGNKLVMGRDPNLIGIVNVGSVGQPRDRDSRACYVVYESSKGYHTLECVRVEYYIPNTARKLLVLDDEYRGYGCDLGLRLYDGK